MRSDPRVPEYPGAKERPDSIGGPPTSTDGSQPWPRLRTSLTYGLLVGIAVLTAALVVTGSRAGFQEEEGGTAIQDFASHLVFSRSVWDKAWTEGQVAGGSRSAYSVEAHLEIMSEWMERDVTFALPFGYSPTMLWVLLPLTLLSVPLAYLIWTAAGALAGARMLSSVRFHWIVGLMAMITPVAVGALALGQTAFLGTVGVFYLAHRTLASDPHRPARLTGQWLALVVVLWALGAKPPLALTAGAAMLALGAIGPVATAVLLTMAGAAILTPWMGSTWIADYATLIGTYDRVAADPAFAWSLHPSHMSNLRAFLSVDLGVQDDVASRTSNLIWVVTLGLVAVGGWRRWIRPPAVWALAILSYLLFCSHVSSTDELLLIVVPALVLPWGSKPRRRLDYLPWLAVPAALVLSPAVGPAADVRPSLLWFVELGLAVWIMVCALRRQPERCQSSVTGGPPTPTPAIPPVQPLPGREPPRRA